MYAVSDVDDLEEITKSDDKLSIDDMTKAMIDYFDSNASVLFEFIHPFVHEYASKGSKPDGESQTWVDAYLNNIARDQEASKFVMVRFFQKIGSSDAAKEYYENNAGALSGGGEHESDVVIATNRQHVMGRLFVRSEEFANDSFWGAGDFEPREFFDLGTLIDKVFDYMLGGSNLRGALLEAAVPDADIIPNSEDLLNHIDKPAALVSLINEDYELYKQVMRNSGYLEEYISEYENEKALELGYDSFMEEIGGELAGISPGTQGITLESIKEDTIRGLKAGQLDLMEVLEKLVELCNNEAKQSGDPPPTSDDLERLQEELSYEGELFPGHDHKIKYTYDRYDRVIIFNREDSPLDDPGLDGQTGTVWYDEADTGESQGILLVLDRGGYVSVPQANVAMEEPTEGEGVDAGGQQYMPFFDDGRLTVSIKEALMKFCVGSTSAYLLMDSIEGMKKSPCINIAVAKEGSKRTASMVGKVYGKSVILHESEDPEITWRDAVYSLNDDYWLVPLRSMIAIKPEDELEIGDHVGVGMHDHEATIIDKHESDEYSYDQYTYEDDEGNVKTVEKEVMRLKDDNPLRLLPKENEDIVMPKTAASGGTGYGDYQEKGTDQAGGGVGGDVSSTHPPPDLAPFDPEKDAEEGSPVPSLEHKKTLMKNRIIKDSVAGRKVDILASKVVLACKSHVIKKAQTNQSVSTYNSTAPAAAPAPVRNTPVAGNPIGGPYQVSENQQDELDANRSEDENVNRNQFQQQQHTQQQQNEVQEDAADLQNVFQQQKIDDANRQRLTTQTDSVALPEKQKQQN
jgi:hypothetical protein